MQRKPQRAAGLGNGTNFVQAVEQAGFRGLGNGDYAWLGKVDVVAIGGQRTNAIGRELAIAGFGCQQFGAIGKKLRRTAFIGFHMGGIGADHAVVALAQGCQCQRVGRRAVEDEKHFTVGFKQAAQRIGCLMGPDIFTIGNGVPGIGFLQGLPGHGANACIVVAGKLLITAGQGLCGHDGAFWMEDSWWKNWLFKG